MEFYNDKKKDHPVFLKFTNIIEKSNKVYVYQIDGIPTLPNQHEPNKKYLNDFKIIKEYKLDSSQINNIKNSVLDTLNYIKDFKKSCPINAKYGIKFEKGKDYITLIISDISCEKAIIFSSKQPINKIYMDLTANNSIHKFLTTLE